MVQNIYFFGSLKDGFKCYPSSNSYSHYYDNTPDGWVFSIRKNENKMFYIFVKYGVFTSIKDGRSGSCFGIAIEFNGVIFDDVTKLRKEFIEDGVIATMLQEEKLIKKYSEFQLAFIPDSLQEVSDYLDRWATRIKSVLNTNLKKQLVPIPYNISNATKKTIGLHPLSNQIAIDEYFKKFGSIDISEKYPIEHISLSEKQVREEAQRQKKHNEQREKYIQKLELLLKQKDGVVEQRNKTIYSLQEVISDYRINSGSQSNDKEEENESIFDYFRQMFKRKEKPKKEERSKSFIFHPLFFVPFLLILVGGITISVLSSINNESTLQVVKTERGNQRPPKTNRTPPPPRETKTPSNPNPPASEIIYEDACIYTNREKTLGMLRIDEFLKYATNAKLEVASIDDFKIDLTTYLMDKSTIAKKNFDSEINLWNQIKKKKSE